MFKRPALLLATAALCSVASPANAGTGWTSPQQIDPKAGRDINLSSKGSTAVWIRTSSPTGTGTVRWNYRIGKAAWKTSKALPMASGVSDVQISADATLALMRTATGWSASTRLGTVWAPPADIGLPATAENVHLASSGSVIAFTDSAGSTKPPAALPCTVKAMTRNADGTWAAPVVIGSTPSEFYGCLDDLALSADGTTLAWMSTGYALNISRLVAGAWTAQAPVFVPGYDLYYLALSADGTRVLWQYSTEDDTYAQVFDGAAWSPAVSVTSSGAIRPHTSVDGRTFAFDSENGFETYWFNGTGWKRVVLLSGNVATSTSVANNAVAYAEQGQFGSGPLRVSTRSGAVWSQPVQVAKSANYPAVSANGKSLVWMSGVKKALYAVRR